MHSLRIRLTASIAALLLIFAIVSVTAIVSLVRIDRQIETINRKWLAGTQMLGDLKNTVSEFRVAEGYRFLATDQSGVVQAEFLAERQATIVSELIGRFAHMAAEVDMLDDFDRFQSAWRNLLSNHRTWIDEAAGDQNIPSMGYGSPLQKHYEAVQLAADNLIDDARAAANAEVAAANASAAHVTLLVVALSVAAGLLAVGLMVHAELHVARPLGAITTALTRLANGDRHVHVPELHRRDEIGAMAAAFDVFRRDAVALAEAQERAEALARHDALTGLANRRLFSDRLEGALAVSRTGLAGAVMLVDLDRFKPINDLHGHAAGDLVLCEVAARLRSLTGAGTLVARLGGDEFALILPHQRDREAAISHATRLARRIVERLGEAVTVAGTDVRIGASLGISVMPEDGATAVDVLRTADLAMYRAKQDGRGTFRFFDPAMTAELLARADFEADLRAALEAGQIEPGYEPVVELATRRIVGYDATPRWCHPTRGPVPPALFMPLLDQAGGLGRVTHAILRQSVRDAAGWAPHLHLTVNVSPRQMEDAAFPSTVAAVLLAAGFPPGRLEIALIKTALVEDVAALKASLDGLRALGAGVVLGEFGQGGSNLAMLRDLPFDRIRIDASFTDTILADPAGAAIFDAMLGLARTLKVPVTAEGITTAAVADLLAERGCALGQGRLFAGDGAAPALARAEPLREAG